MITARVSRNIGAVHADGAVLSTRRLPVAGKIRPGVKVLTKAAAANPALAKCYAAALARLTWHLERAVEDIADILANQEETL
jgi:hypothetical protein